MLIECPECHKEVSDQAIACPNCGFPISELALKSAVKEDSSSNAMDGGEKNQGAGSGDSNIEQTSSQVSSEVEGGDIGGDEIQRIKAKARIYQLNRKHELAFSPVQDKDGIEGWGDRKGGKVGRSARGPVGRERFGVAKKDFGIVLAVIPYFAALLVLVWIGNMRLIDNPSAALGLVGFFVVIITTILAISEMQSVEGGAKPNVGKWAAGFVLLGPLAYTYYMAKRSTIGLKGLALPSLIGVVVYLLSVGFVWHAIGEQQQKVHGALNKIQRDIEELGGWRRY